MVPHECPKLGDDAPRVVIYTDGGCKPNPGAGGWAAVLLSGDQELEIAGAQPSTTNNRMEMTAALRALELLTQPSRVTVVTDSKYLMGGITDWITKWSEAGFHRPRNPVKNVPLWKALAKVVLAHETTWAWVKGHADNLLNDRCDTLATQMIERAPFDGDGILHRERRDASIPLPDLETLPTAKIWLDD